LAADRLVDGTLDIVLGHGFRLGRDDGGPQAGIVRRVGQAGFGCDGDLAGELGKELGALLILLALAEHDVLELTMTGHRASFPAGAPDSRPTHLISRAPLSRLPRPMQDDPLFGP